ncbi:MAG: hypothetical protein NTW32_17665 [Chloroflexi bacterium]|nr:hypothetical protein [Chloroflexota bacterium]
MNKKSGSLFLVFVFGLSTALLNFQTAFAHTPVTDGTYTIEVGWAEEPPVVGQRNAVVINVSDSANPDADIDISMLVVEVSYGGQTKTLTLQPLSEDSKNQYITPILPAVAGKYTVKLSGKLGTTTISNSVEPEEVQAADVLSFPSVTAEKPAQPAALGLSAWLAIAALIVGLAGLVLGFFAFQKSR